MTGKYDANGHARYEVISAYSKDKINAKSSNMTKIILSAFTEKGERFSPKDLIENNKNIIPHSCSHDSFASYHYIALKEGVHAGILSRCNAGPHGELESLSSVKYWQSQLRSSKYKNIRSQSSESKTTRGLYLYLLNEFNRWLVSKEFKIRKTVQMSENTLKIVEQNTSFSSAEELLKLFDSSPSSQKDVIKIIREYLTPLNHNDVGPSYMKSKFSAIMSYFDRNESPLGMRFDSGRFDDQEIRYDSEVTLSEFHDILTVGRPSVMERSVMLVKFQGGFDSSTLADRFNFEGLRQIADYFGSDNHNSWDLERCPVPLRHVRIKTGFQHSPLLDRDAIASIQQYLDWRIREYGKHDVSGPLYLNRRGRPITSWWISSKFFDLAKRAGNQKKISHNQYKIRAHELRDLLKSTLIDSGCRIDVADHVIGHKPKDSYEKQARLYPETLRKEYAKASKRLNIFTKFTSVVNGTDDSDALRAELREKLSEMEKIRRRSLDDEAEKMRNDAVARQNSEQMSEMMGMIRELKRQANRSKQNKGQKMEFCCIGCSTVHDSEQCPACGSRLKRVYENAGTA